MRKGHLAYLLVCGFHCVEYLWRVAAHIETVDLSVIFRVGSVSLCKCLRAVRVCDLSMLTVGLSTIVLTTVYCTFSGDGLCDKYRCPYMTFDIFLFELALMKSNSASMA